MTYFVRINDVKGLRRRLLEGSRDILHMLKAYNRLLDIRERKRDLAERIRTVMQELRHEAEHLERLMPEKSLDEIKDFLPKRSPKKAAKKTEKKGKKRQDAEEDEDAQPEAAPPRSVGNEAERLESALAKIEERLSRL